MTTATSSKDRVQASQEQAGAYVSALRSQTLESPGAKLATGRAGDATNSQLIDSKFDQLAKKIMDELKQVQYSRAFFGAVDEILREPILSEFTRIYQQQHQQQQLHQQQKRRLQSLNSDNSQRLFQREPLSRQPRSLPVDVAAAASPKQQQPAEKPKSSRTTQTDFGPDHSGLAKQQSPSIAATRSYPMGKSATVGNAQSLKSQLAVAKSASPSSQIRQVEGKKLPSADQAQPDKFYWRQRNHSASSIGRIVASYDGPNEDDDDDDDDDEDDDDDDEDDDEGRQDVGFAQSRRQSSFSQDKSRAAYLGQRFSNPSAKSRIPDNIIDPTTRQEQQQQSDGGQQRRNQTQEQRQRFGNPLVRSSTISAGQQHQRTDSAEPRSVNLLSHRDMGFLYKPHMNYSTSLLGNHRLSDDDEIIIIPTQSPSLVSDSPDNEANIAEEQIERFSISRTKSFWEKLSKGNRASSKATSSSGQDNNDGPDALVRAAAKTNSKQHHSGAGSKVVGVRANGHSAPPFDRLDSTGGSNSNYSCSSSGDENNCNSSTSQPKHRGSSGRPQEMCRQNILRQTR